MKLYPGEDVVHQAPAGIDPDLWTDEGELTELREIPVGDVVLRETCTGPANPNVMATPDADIPMISDSPEDREMREGIHKRIQERYTMRTGREHSKRKRGWMYLRDGTMSKI